MKESQNRLQSGRDGGQSEVYQRVPHFAEMTTQLKHNDWKPGKNVAITGHPIVLVYP